MKEHIKKLIEQAVGGDAPSFSVEVPTDKTHGDYATNIALALAKKAEKNPREAAQEIVEKIRHTNILKNIGIEKVEVAGPGFINFYLSREFFAENVKNILKLGEYFGRIKKPFFGAEKVIVEYTDPNPFKYFHIGHLSSNAIGESISRLIEFQGTEIKRVNYQGDVGRHVARAIWGKRNNPNLNWGQAYAEGVRADVDSSVAHEEITILNKKIYERTDEEINILYDQGKAETLSQFERMYKLLGTKFDHYFFESEAWLPGKKVVEKGLKEGIFQLGEKGAIVFNGTHTRVFINSEGLPTYEAKDLVLAKIKYDKYKYDKSVIITAYEVNEYFKVVLEAMRKVFPDLSGKTEHIGHGFLRLPEGKMSSRTGKVVTAESLIEKIKAMVRQKAVNKALDDATVEKIAVGAVKYSILKQSIGSNIIFDFEKSISFEGDSGPYLQYSYVRAISVLAKAKAEGIKYNTNMRMNTNATNVSALEKMMIYFPEIVEKAGKEYQPHHITLYLTELAREFNNYYAKYKIVDKTDEFSPHKVAITQAFSIIMKNGLWLLGIQTPSKM